MSKLLLISVYFVFDFTSYAKQINVRIKETVISGKSESFEGKAYNVFKGVPYAEPPVGRLRFRKPVPLRQWPKKIKAYEWPDPCYQSSGKTPKTFITFNEDCLKLNIWTPGDSRTTDRLRPVLFYIHGGGLLVGAAERSGEVLVTRGDIILVDIQYRLSTLGFLYGGNDAAPGNMGFLDQVMALEWVNDNIQYFGGDPNQITIMGLSAGSWSVSGHILSPLTRNLFRYAIIQSGVITDHIMYPRKCQQKKNWLRGAELIGCNEEKARDFNDKIMECLRSANASKLQTIPRLPELMQITIMPMIIVDGHFLPRVPSKMFKSGNFKQNISLMISTAADEGSFFLTTNGDRVKYDKINPKKLSFNETITEWKSLSQKMKKKFDIDSDEAAKIYFNGLSNETDPDLLRRTIGIAFGDFLIQCPTILFGKEIFRRSHHKINVYQYYWNEKTKSKLPNNAKWWGPAHGEDLPATFGMPMTMKNVFAEKDREMSEKLIDAISNFVKTGTPGAIDGTVWPKYFSIDDHIVSPYYEFTSSAKPNTKFSYGLKITECEYLWRKHIIFD